MTRVRSLVAVVLPSMLVGGLVLGHSYAAPGGGDAPSWGDNLVADATRPNTRRVPPGPPLPPPTPDDTWGTPPVPPVAPVPPIPPVHVGGRHGGVSVSIHDGQIQIDGIDAMVRGQLEAARQALAANPRIPKDVRDKLTARLDRASATINKRLKNLKATDLQQLEVELESMGEELEQALEGLDQDLAGLGDQLQKDLAKQLGKNFKQLRKQGIQIDLDDDFDVDVDVDVDGGDDDDADDDVPTAMPDLGGVKLQPAQRDAILKLRQQSDAQVAQVRAQLAVSSRQLEAALANPRTSDAEVARLVDQVSGHEAAIRKARLLAWVQARRLLDAGQIQQLERATGPR